MLGKSCIRLIELSFLLLKPVTLLQIRIGEVNLSFNEKEIAEKIIEQFKLLGFEPLLDADKILVEKNKTSSSRANFLQLQHQFINSELRLH